MYGRLVLLHCALSSWSTFTRFNKLHRYNECKEFDERKKRKDNVGKNAG